MMNIQQKMCSQWSTSPGIKITNIEELDKKGIDRQKLVIDVHKVFFTMLLRHSIFHADPHPGNISVKDDGTLILYDFGIELEG